MLENSKTGLSMTIFLFTFNGKRLIKTRIHDYILDKLWNNLTFQKTIFFIINITTYMTKDILLIFALDMMTSAPKLLPALAIIVNIASKNMRKDEHRSNPLTLVNLVLQR